MSRFHLPFTIRRSKTSLDVQSLLPPQTSRVRRRIHDLCYRCCIQILDLAIVPVHRKLGQVRSTGRTIDHERGDVLLQCYSNRVNIDHGIGPVVKSIGDVLAMKGWRKRELIRISLVAVGSIQCISVATIKTGQSAEFETLFVILT